jgi:hypothetical protein
MKSSKTSLMLFISIAIPLAVYLMVYAMFGSHTGANYDAYQYSFALREGRSLSQEEFDNASRLFVHAGYYILLRPLVVLGLDAWSAFAWSSMLFMALSAGLLYILGVELGVPEAMSAVLSTLFALSSTALHYCNIPEIYPMWLAVLLLLLFALWRGQALWSVILFGLAFVTYVQSVLLLPVFWMFGLRRGTLLGVAAAVTGAVLLMIVLYPTGVNFLGNMTNERVYLEIASQNTFWLRSNLVALRQSGALVPLVLSIPLWLTARSLGRAERFLLLALVPNLIFALLWVTNHGAFFLPVSVTGTLLFSVLASRTKNYRPVLAVATLLIVSALPWAWSETTYDRSLGLIQYEFCRNALPLIQDEAIISTALYPRWQYVMSQHNIEREHLRYSPWAFTRSQEAAMESAVLDMVSYRTAYADDTVHPDILDKLRAEPVYSYSGTLHKGTRATLTLYRFSVSDSEPQP